MAVVVLIIFCVLVYWVASFVTLLLRAYSDSFSSLTSYSARQRAGTWKAATSSADEDDEGRPRRTRLLESAVAKLKKLQKPLANSLLARRWIPRKASFSAFYLTGLVTVMCLFWYWGNLEVPCRRSVTAAVEHELLTPFLTSHKQPRNVDPFNPRGGMLRRANRHGQEPAEGGRYTEAWKRFLRHNPEARHSPFAELKGIPEANYSLIRDAARIYNSELDQCQAFVVPLRKVELLPLIAFGIHCLIRLAECLFVHRFRSGAEDLVTPFATIAGCTFYAIAALSSSIVLFVSVRSTSAERGFFAAGLHPDDGNTSRSRFSVLLEARRKNTTSAMHLGAQDDLVHMGRLAAPMAYVVNTSTFYVPAVVVGTLFLLHLLLQVVQAIHHDALAQLRRPVRARFGSRRHRIGVVIQALRDEGILGRRLAVAHAVATASNNRDTALLKRDGLNARNTTSSTTGGEEVDGHTGAEANPRHPGAGRDYTPKGVEQLLLHHFPYRLLFQYVLEPHYTCEIFMYAVNAISNAVLLFYAVFPPAALSIAMPLLPYYQIDLDGGAVLRPNIVAVMLCILLASLAPFVFTALNLSLTAAEHRRFWADVNEERELLATLLTVQEAKYARPPQPRAGGAFKVPPPPTRSGEEVERMIHRDTILSGGEDEEEEEEDVRMAAETEAGRRHRELRTALQLELLPQNNIIPYIY